MKKPFKDPIAPHVKKASKTFAAPTGDQLKLKGLGGGDYYGTGFKAKVGKERGMGKSNVPMKSFCAPPDSVA